MQKSVQQYAKKCRSCGRSFFAKKSDAKYCSRSCRAIYNRQLASDDDEATIIDFYTGALLDPTELNVMNKTVGFKAQRLEIEPICRNKKYRHGIGNLGVAANSEYDVLAFISEREAGTMQFKTDSITSLAII